MQISTTTQFVNTTPAAGRYARCVEVSRRVRWDTDADVIRGREFDYSHKFLPDGLSLVHELDFLDPGEQRFLSQIQGRTYANIFGLVERFINAKVLELSQHHWFGDQVALEALIRFSEEELKHQELFRRIEPMVAEGMPEGYALVADPNDVARIVLGKSTWSVLGLTCHIELFTQQHYKQSIKPCEDLSDLYKDMLLAHVSIAFAFTWIYRQGRKDGDWLGQGLRYGLAIAFVANIPFFMIYHAVAQFPFDLMVKEIVGDTAGVVVAGLAVAFVHK